MKSLIAITLLLALTTGCATIHRHQYATALGIVGVGVATGVYLGLQQAHCDHYEPGNNGVNAPCPKDHTPNHH